MADDRFLKLADRGHELLAAMKAAPTAGPNHAAAWEKLRADIATWEKDCSEALTPSGRARFHATHGREADWPNYSDLIHNTHKQLAADLAARTQFLAGLE